MDERQQRRVAANEARFRALNERQTAAAAEFHGADDQRELEIVCECAISECDDMVPIDAEEYRRVRGHATWFIIRPDHLIPQVEQLVEQETAYWIVEKIGAGAELAKERR